MNCPHCGKGNKSGNKFCTSCGSTLEEKKDVKFVFNKTAGSWLCPHCGSFNKPEKMFCDKCGRRIRAETSATSEYIQSTRNASNGAVNAIVKFGMYVLVYGVLNLLLWGGQELYYHKDTVKANAMKSELVTEKAQLDQLESKITSNQTILDQKDTILASYKDAGNIDMYNAGVGSYNALLSSIKSDITKYDATLSTYNSKVDQYNEIIKRSSSRWWLIPIPIPGNHSIPHG